MGARTSKYLDRGTGNPTRVDRRQRVSRLLRGYLGGVATRAIWAATMCVLFGRFRRQRVLFGRQLRAGAEGLFELHSFPQTSRVHDHLWSIEAHACPNSSGSARKNLRLPFVLFFHIGPAAAPLHERGRHRRRSWRLSDFCHAETRFRRSFGLKAIAAIRKTSPKPWRAEHPHNKKSAGLEPFF